MRHLSSAITIVAVIVALLIFLGRREMMGTRYPVSDREAVNYSGNATEDDARKLAEVLRQIGFFDGSRAADVLLRKREKEGTVVSFIVNRTPPEVVAAYGRIGRVVADQALGRPLTIRLLDDKLNQRHEFRVE